LSKRVERWLALVRWFTSRNPHRQWKEPAAAAVAAADSRKAPTLPVEVKLLVVIVFIVAGPHSTR
jgi:hypothetical protein